MARGVGYRRGGIQGLVELLDEHGEAVEYDLIALGLRLADLGTPRLTWRDLLVIVRQSPRTSALNRARLGEAADWGVTDHLLAGVFDLLAGANWQRGGDNKAPRPKPLKRPGSKPEGQKFGGDAIPISEFDAWWGAGTPEPPTVGKELAIYDPYLARLGSR